MRAVDVVMARAKRIYIFIIKVSKLFSFFSSWCFLKEIENMNSVFLSSYTTTRESSGELEKAVETLACGSCSHSISRSPKLPLVFVLGTFRSEDEDDYEYEFSVLSMRTSKNVGLQTLCACSVLKTRTRSRPRPPI